MGRRKYPKGESPWKRMFFRKSDMVSYCFSCKKELPIGTMIFVLPDLRQGASYCETCMIKKINLMSIAESL